MDWNRLIVDVLLILLTGFALLQLARTTWHAQARAAESERLLSSLVLAQRPETAGLAHQVAPIPVPMPGNERHPAFNGAIPVAAVAAGEVWDDVNAP